MAPFNPGINQTNDPTYTGASRGYSKSDVAVDTSLGQALNNAGDLVGLGVNAIDAGIQRSAKEDLYTEIDRIRNEHGADVSPDEVTAIAGKGGRGSKFAQATTAGDDLAMEEVPAGVSTKVSGLKRMKAAYDAGKLSDSHYYSSLEAAVKEIRSRYPGYRDQIDGMVSTITGVTPANALRTSIKQDMQSMAAASQSAANKIETQFLKDREYLQTLKPGLSVGEYAANKQQWDVQVGLLQARDYRIKADSASLELMDKKDKNTSRAAERVFTDAANQTISNFMKGTINQLQIKSEELARQGPSANPKEVQALAQEWQIVEGQLRQNIKNLARRPLSDGSTNSYSTYLTPAQVQAVEDQAISVMKPIIANLGVKETGAAMASSNIIKNRDHQDILRMQDKFPVTRALTAAQATMGPQVSGVLAQQSQVLPEVTKAMTDLAWLTVADKGGGAPPTVSEILGAHKGGDPEKKIPAKVVEVTTNGLLTLAEHPDPEVAARAVQTLYADPKFFANIPAKDKVRVYTKLGTKEFTQKMITLGEVQPEARDNYFRWMEQNFPVVVKQSADDVQQLITNPDNYTVSFSPTAFGFVVKTNPQVLADMRARNDPRALYQASGRGEDPNQQYATELNRGIKALEPVLKAKYGNEAPAELARLIQSMPGIDFSAAPKSSIFRQVGDAMKSWFKDTVGYTKEDDVLGIKVDNIPDGMSAKEFIRMLQTEEKDAQSPGK